MTGRGIICSFSNLQLSGGQEIWTQQSLMWKEVRGPQAGPSAPAPPWQREWVIFTLFGTPALWNCYGQARCNLWLRLQSTRWKVRSIKLYTDGFENKLSCEWPAGHLYSIVFYVWPEFLLVYSTSKLSMSPAYMKKDMRACELDSHKTNRKTLSPRSVCILV